MSNAGGFDGETAFDLTTDLSVDDEGIITQSLTANAGRINRASMNPIVGSGGYFLRGFEFYTTPEITEIGVGIMQPGSNIVRAGGSEEVQVQWCYFHSQDWGVNPPASNTFMADNYYVPPGWELILLAHDGAAVEVGPYSFILLFDAPSSVLEAVEGYFALEQPIASSHALAP